MPGIIKTRNRLVEVADGFPRVRSEDYRKLAPEVISRCRLVAGKLRGRTVIHINATPVGGGVVEILRSQIPIERSLGVKSRWLVIQAQQDFFAVTKKIHNLLQGKPGRLSATEKALYFKVNRELGESFLDFVRSEGICDAIVVVHDPQPLPMSEFIPDSFRKLFRLHIDVTTANPSMLAVIKPFIPPFRKTVISSRDYLRAFSWLPKSKLAVVQPAIDAFSPKNRSMSSVEAARLMAKFGIDSGRPLISQVSRFDPWKNPVGVIKAYRTAKKSVPNLQLAMAGFMAAKDDPEAITVFEEVRKLAGNDEDIHLFAEMKQLGNVSNDRFINALLTASTVVVQNSTREGFGLTMTEAMWHGKPLVAGRTAGALMQISNGRNGLLVGDSPHQLAASLLRLLKDAPARKRLGRAARESVRKRFLMSRYVLDNLKLYVG